MTLFQYLGAWFSRENYEYTELRVSLANIRIPLQALAMDVAAIKATQGEHTNTMSALSDAIGAVQAGLTTFHTSFDTAIADLQAKLAAGGQVTPDDLTNLGNIATELGALDVAAKAADPGQ